MQEADTRRADDICVRLAAMEIPFGRRTRKEDIAPLKKLDSVVAKRNRNNEFLFQMA